MNLKTCAEACIWIMKICSSAASVVPVDGDTPAATVTPMSQSTAVPQSAEARKAQAEAVKAQAEAGSICAAEPIFVCPPGRLRHAALPDATRTSLGLPSMPHATQALQHKTGEEPGIPEEASPRFEFVESQHPALHVMQLATGVGDDSASIGVRPVRRGRRELEWTPGGTPTKARARAMTHAWTEVPAGSASGRSTMTVGPNKT